MEESSREEMETEKGLYKGGAHGIASRAAPLSNQARSMPPRRLHRWLAHGSKAHLQCVLSGSFDGTAKEASAKAASTSSIVRGEELFRGAFASCCSSVEQAGQNDARRLHRWLEHSSKAHRQQILCKATMATKDNYIKVAKAGGDVRSR